MRYLLLDRIDEMKKFSYAIGTKCISLSDDCFEHHFPGQPIYPGALLIEAMAQLGGAMLEISLIEEDKPCPRCVLSTVKAKFRHFVKPGDQLSIRTDIVSLHDDSALVRATTGRENQRLCQAEMVFVFIEIDEPKLEASRKDFLHIVTRQTRFIET